MKKLLILISILTLVSCANTTPKHTYSGQVNKIYTQSVNSPVLVGSGSAGGVFFGAIGAMVEGAIRTNSLKKEFLSSDLLKIQDEIALDIRYVMSIKTKEFEIITESISDLDFLDWFNTEVQTNIPKVKDANDSLLVRYSLREVVIYGGDRLSFTGGVVLIDMSNGNVVGKNIFNSKSVKLNKDFDKLSYDEKYTKIRINAIKAIKKSISSAMEQIG